MISVVTPAYNAARFIQDTVESVRDQTYQDWEMLIVDDCSSDDTVQVVKDLSGKDPRIRLFALEENVGAAEARNIAFRHAKGQYIAFLDSDDLWVPEKLEKQLRFLQQNNHAFTFTDYECITEDGSEVLYTVHAPAEIGYRRFLRNTTIGTLTVMIDRKKTGDFEMPQIRSSHDMALWLSLMHNGFKAYGLQEVLAKYRQVGTSNTASKWKAAKDVWKVYRNIEKLNWFDAGFNFAGYAVNAILKRMK
ncbi:MAG: glycosyltransferase [Bacteroidales bacterium]|nr:glycosyltransferase [Bacteroidales bacterium]MCF8328475.1 glycosyltransferase [Bacteroidales bacterium]